MIISRRVRIIRIRIRFAPNESVENVNVFFSFILHFLLNPTLYENFCHHKKSFSANDDKERREE